MSYQSLTNKLFEVKYKEVADKQKSIVNLFPSFYDRVNKVKEHGGTQLTKTEGEVWTFKVRAGDDARFKRGDVYSVRVFFDGIENSIEEGAKQRGNWTKSGEHLNLSALGAWGINHCDLSFSCNCKASRYWGPNYQRTQVGAELDHDEQRPPDVRNPNQYGINCKHVQNLMDTLQFYSGTFATEILKKYYSKFILDLEKKLLKKKFNGATKAKPVAQPETPETNKLDVSKSQQEEEFNQGEPEETEKEEMAKLKGKPQVKKSEPIKKLSPKQEQEAEDFNNPKEENEL